MWRFHHTLKMVTQYFYKIITTKIVIWEKFYSIFGDLRNVAWRYFFIILGVVKARGTWLPSLPVQHHKPGSPSQKCCLVPILAAYSIERWHHTACQSQEGITRSPPAYAEFLELLYLNPKIQYQFNFLNVPSGPVRTQTEFKIHIQWQIQDD